MRPEEEGSDEYDDELDDEEEPSAWLGLVYLFFSPRAFFEAFAERPAPLLTAGCAWLLGMTISIAIVLAPNRDSGASIFPESWGALWTSALVGGAVLGGGAYVLGGAMYRIELSKSIVSDPDPALARRVLLYSALIAGIPTVVGMALVSKLRATPDAWLADRSPWLCVMFAFPAWAIVTNFIGVRTVFSMRGNPSRVRLVFLVGPLVSLLAYAAYVTGFTAPPAAELPDVRGSVAYEGERVTFANPGNWELEVNEREDAVESVKIRSLTRDATVRVMAYAKRGRSAREELTASVARFTHVEEWREGPTFDSWGEASGVGRTGSFLVDGTPYSGHFFVADVDADRLLEIHAYYPQPERRRVRPVLDLVGATVKVK